ncbi:MAG: SpoIIE family protein phosphatase [Candidatus Eremiobacteraeota bacterium]|nr:SpoIIE family protein phosphatase [Candidatus Eremiobacteraeota bacterium]MBV9263749.1 SpoIIE family protein phosphatase [Candidatus Eremiobacteraeota bacterium]
MAVKTAEERDLTSLRFLARITKSLFEAPEPNAMLQRLVETLADVAFDHVSALRFDHRDVRRVAAAGDESLALDPQVQSEIVAAAQERRAVALDSRTHSWITAPLFLHDVPYAVIACAGSAGAFSSTDLELFEELGESASLALAYADSYAREQRLAQTLQKATLPTRLAVVPDAALSVVYRPAAIGVQVGGDWYDSYDLEDDRVLLTIGDVTGHGLQASIVMGKLRHAINVVAMYERDPVRILDTAERIVLRRYPDSVATAFIGIVDATAGTITYANAGHPYPIVRLTDGSLRELRADGLPIGLRSLAPRGDTVSESLAGVDLLAFYTDGLTEAQRDPLAGEQTLHRALQTRTALFVSNVAEFLEDYCLQGPSPDDVAIMCLNFKHYRRWTFDSSDGYAARRARHELVDELSSCVTPESDVKGAEIIFGELTANAAKHAAGRVDVALEWTGDAPVLHFIDRGGGCAMIAPPHPGELTEHGRGFWLLQRLGGEINIEVLPGFGCQISVGLPVVRRRM